jgi:hypothetical protein
MILKTRQQTTLTHARPNRTKRARKSFRFFTSLCLPTPKAYTPYVLYAIIISHLQDLSSSRIMIELSTSKGETPHIDRQQTTTDQKHGHHKHQVRVCQAHFISRLRSL